MAPEIGQELKRARESRGLDMREVERVTKIRPKYLRAMEEDRWADLPGSAYARGFLATYARYLDLDERTLVERYKAGPGQEEGGSPVPEEMLPRRGEVRKHSVRPRGLAKLVGILAAIALVVVALIVASGDGDGEQGAGEMFGGDADATETTNAETEAPEAESDPGPQPREPSPTELELAATGAVWVCLVDNRDRPRVEGETLAAGEERGPFRGAAFEATFGNGSIELTVDGEQFEVPEAAEPLGYRISAGEVEELGEAARPDCA